MKRRFASLRSGWVALILVIVTPLLTGALAMTTVSEPSHNANGQPELRAAIVNNDQIVYEKIDHKKVPVAAGRLLVGELVTNPNDGFDWVITDDAVAKQGLESGDYVAVVTIPDDFSAAYISSSGADPQQATITVETDGSHSYMAAILALALTQDLTSGVSTQLTQQFVDGLLVGYTELGEGLGALATGSSELTVGLQELSTLTKELPVLTKELASGAHLLNTGINTFAKDLLKLAAVSKEAAKKTRTVAEQVALLTLTVEAWQPGTPADDLAKAEMLLQLSTLNTNSDEAALKAEETNVGVALAEAYAKELHVGSSALAEGTKELSAGMPALHKGIHGAYEGSKIITKGLDKVVKNLPTYTDAEATQLSKVVATPVVTKTVTKPKLPQAIGAVGAVVIPIALWLGALAISFIRPAFSRRALPTRASNARIVANAAVPYVVLAVAQGALILIGLYVFHLQPIYHFMLTAVVAASAVAFALLHQGLVALTGKFAWLISIALMSVQILAAGVVLPSAFVPDWVTTLGKTLPLSESIIAMQEVITGGQRQHVTAAIAWILVSAVVGVILSLVAVARGRKVRVAYA